MSSRIPSSPPIFPVDSTRSRRSSESGASSTVVESEDSSYEAKILQAKSTEQKIADDLGQKIPGLGDKGKERDESVDLSSSSADHDIIEIAPKSPAATDVSSYTTTTTVGPIVAAPPGAGPGGPALPAPGPPPGAAPPGSLVYRALGGFVAFAGASSGFVFMSEGLSNSNILLSSLGGGVSVLIGIAGLGFCFIPELSRLRAWTGHADPT